MLCVYFGLLGSLYFEVFGGDLYLTTWSAPVLGYLKGVAPAAGGGRCRIRATDGRWAGSVDVVLGHDDDDGGAAFGDEALDYVFAGTDDDVSYHAAEFNLHHFSFDTVARGKRHGAEHTFSPKRWQAWPFSCVWSRFDITI